MIVLQSPIVSPGVLERELVYLSPRVAGAIESGGQPPLPGPLLHSAWRRGRRLPGRHFRPHRTVAGDWLSGDGPSTDRCPFRICPR